MRRQSIFFKLFFLFMAFTVILIGLFWFLQDQFFHHYYVRQKVDLLEEYSSQIQGQIVREGFSQKTMEQIGEMADELNGRIIIFDRGEKILHHEGMSRMNRVYKILPDLIAEAHRGKTVFYKITGPSYPLEVLAVAVGLEENIYFFQTPLQPIEEAVAVTQQFTVYLLLIAFVAALLLSWFFSKTITKPLIQLNAVAQEMGRLNFDAKWDRRRRDEIGELGETLNHLTEKLKTTIDALQKELQKEKKLEKMRKQFVARVSHELQTPIALIQGYTEALQDGVATNGEEEKEYFHIINGETKKISKLVKDLLDLGQLESGNFKVEIEVIEIIPLLHNILEKFDVFTKEKQLTFRIKVPQQDFQVWGDPYRIEQVLTNLLQNAINHCDIKGKIDLQLREEGKKVRVSVYNEGDGIPEGHLEDIWKSFYKGGEGKKGVGLGLAIVKNVLDLHGSDYGVINKEKGVEFYFYLRKVS